MNFDRLGGRRFVMAQQVLILASALLAFGKLAGAEWVTVVLGTVGVYVAGNVAQRKVEAATAPAVD